ncbi:hypothetical protein PHYSODRAFT_329465 [Phytophthora sojae]|uniref:Uncharacterized protein n=1 Tax=Phytophthora sojae (strain P6497) TaxID=1094619 RepID=G4Z3Y2_PHYSP|nr:hypothetical protein PHYSODRAFT_329465 [Phytophthora sojae]EGZ21534.1 hypothetical protein PHYSODRAFT_329465 [Phytophthora sojae]|eukprot:XP_009524251.1 hypothetical protein PHYSODRAFT_329465 [Phytophthora sojae]
MVPADIAPVGVAVLGSSTASPLCNSTEISWLPLQYLLLNIEARRQHNPSESDGRADLDASPNDSSTSTGAWTYAEDGTRIFQGPATSLFKLMEAMDTGLHRLGHGTFALDETTLSMEKLSLTDQLSIQVLTIDIVLNASVVYGQTFEDAACYCYKACGSSSSNGSATSSSSTNASFVAIRHAHR